MTFSRPLGTAADFSFGGGVYARPPAESANFGSGVATVVFPDGIPIEVDAIAAPSLVNSRDFLGPTGFHSLSCGYPTVKIPGHYVRPLFFQADFQSAEGSFNPPVWSGADFGSPPEGAGYLWPASISPPHIPLAAVNNAAAQITLGGSDFGAGGKPSVWLYTRTLRPAGGNMQALGAGSVTHGVRYVVAAGGADLNARGAPWVSRSPRTLEPTGPDVMRVLESHVVGGTRYIEAHGWDSQAFGERIIPEGQALYPAGFAGESGKPDVQLYTRYLQAKQFETNPDDLRFGRQDVWNLRQIVQQDYDPNDDLNPQPFGQWTGIENRNKEPVPVGWLSERIGYQFVWNKASPVLPSGVAPPADAPTYKAGSVTHWRREVAPPGVDSFASERWHALFNTADVLAPAGSDHQAFGRPALENRSRLYDKVGNFDTMATGTPMVADRIRELTFESRYSIEPPPLPLPEVKLHTRYVEYVSVGDRLGAGSPVLDIRWTYIATKWSFHPPAWIGEPALRNVTPELRTGGANHEEFGEASIRTQWRRIETQYGDMVQWGRPIVRDRRHWVEFVTVGAPPNNLPGPKVTKVGGLPDPQGIQPPGVMPPGGGEQNIQVPRPTLNLVFAYADGFNSLRVGNAVVTANSIRVEPGYWELLIGAPQVTLKNRAVLVAKFPDAEVFQPSEPSLSPHTVYAVFEAPKQAKENHGYRGLHYVDHDPSNNRPIKGVGNHTVTNLHRVVGARGFTWFNADSQWPSPVVLNMRRIVAADGWHSLRVGMHQVPGPQDIVQFSAADSAAFGKPDASPPPYVGPTTIGVHGIQPPPAPSPVIEFLHRAFDFTGWESLHMGASIPGDTPYQWRGLRLGPLMPTIPQGEDMQQFGDPWVSLAVRDLPLQGWDSFSSEYDIDAFDHRMRVTRTPAPKPPTQHITHQGAPTHAVGTPGIKLGAHYIRPDGNAETYRKGAP